MSPIRRLLTIATLAVAIIAPAGLAEAKVHHPGHAKTQLVTKSKKSAKKHHKKKHKKHHKKTTKKTTSAKSARVHHA